MKSSSAACCRQAAAQAAACVCDLDLVQEELNDVKMLQAASQCLMMSGSALCVLLHDSVTGSKIQPQWQAAALLRLWPQEEKFCDRQAKIQTQ